METFKMAEEVLQLVTFILENEEYAVDIMKVKEINRMTEITRIPNSAHYVEGVINLRGKVIPVINLRKMIGLTYKEDYRNSTIIIMDIRGATTGFIVDSVSEVLRIPSSSVDPPPVIESDKRHDFIKGISKLDNRLIILVDMEKLINESRGAGITEELEIDENKQEIKGVT